jgi:hypothetical protein
MHNLGLKDVIVAADAADEPAELLRTFTRYVFAEQADVRVGQTFSVAPDAPIYRIVEDEGVSYAPSSLFNNPYGFWRLEPRTAGDVDPATGEAVKRSWWKLGKS